jgi:hypothetical protein
VPKFQENFNQGCGKDARAGEKPFSESLVKPLPGSLVGKNLKEIGTPFRVKKRRHDKDATWLVSGIRHRKSVGTGTSQPRGCFQDKKESISNRYDFQSGIRA